MFIEPRAQRNHGLPMGIRLGLDRRFARGVHARQSHEAHHGKRYEYRKRLDRCSHWRRTPCTIVEHGRCGTDKPEQRTCH